MTYSEAYVKPYNFWSVPLTSKNTKRIPDIGMKPYHIPPNVVAIIDIIIHTDTAAANRKSILFKIIFHASLKVLPSHHVALNEINFDFFFGGKMQFFY